MAAIYGFVLGFGYGNLLEAKYGFELREWQTLVGVLVAVAAAVLAFIGVRGTQRVNVVLKEQDRLDKLLPGLRQANDFLGQLCRYLEHINDHTRYLSITVVRDCIQFQTGESFEAMVDRRLPLADDETKREVTGVVLSLVRQTTMLQLAKEEHTKSFKDLADLHLFAEESKQSVRDQAQRIDLSLKRLNEETAAEFDAVKRAADSLKNRLEEGEGRRKAIGRELDQYFRRE
ncbi:hypothetical protein G8O24_42055 [Bradyrhizobium sp. INPA01-394B]|uniref:Uncharacterized protein n=1 Tax=Bradyrhizobium campsiandrae TaxID=1729892 RepID=A0ABR7TYX3_9BRAD|nr:hypothetical protein [Bradyrhizobium campsiandrae]MBC9883860.1 hypothetical protein [Bradyrhizobium campsiandrae]MBC9976803.1 hypothetical protein [Bradyrhizobium campsiandrae]